jgi:hypothetical protein
MIGLWRRWRDNVQAAPLLSSCAYRPKNGRLDGEARRPRAGKTGAFGGRPEGPCVVAIAMPAHAASAV